MGTARAGNGALSHAPCDSAAAVTHGTRNVSDLHNKLCDNLHDEFNRRQ